MKTSILLTFLINASLFFAHPVFSQTTIQTLVLCPGPADGFDAEIRTDLPQTPRGSSPDFIANAWTAQGNFFITRGLLKFDLSSIPTEAVVTKATLFLYTNLNTGHYQLDSGANAARLMRVTEPWSEDQVFWDNQPAASGTDPVLLPQSVTHTQNYEADVTEHVGTMVKHPEVNFGWLFRLDTEETYRCMVFASSDNMVAHWRPKLVVEYLACSDPVAGFCYAVNATVAQFADTSVCANPLSWLWDFGDSTSSTLQNPEHEYSDWGMYNVCLTIANECGQDLFCTPVTMLAPLLPGFSSMQNESDDLKVSFEDHSQGATTWLWDFGDGKTSGDQNPVHVYERYGDYNVCLTAGNPAKHETACNPLTVKKLNVHSNGSSMLFYPNPLKNNDDLNFILFEDAARAEITITEMSGRTLFIREYLNIGKNEPVKIHLTGLAKGTYLLKGTFNKYSKTVKLEVF